VTTSTLPSSRRDSTGIGLNDSTSDTRNLVSPSLISGKREARGEGRGREEVIGSSSFIFTLICTNTYLSSCLCFASGTYIYPIIPHGTVVSEGETVWGRRRKSCSDDADDDVSLLLFVVGW